MTGSEIKALRLKIGLSQKALARQLGVNYHTISAWEHGKCAPRPLQARMLADMAAGRLTEYGWIWDGRPITDGP